MTLKSGKGHEHTHFSSAGVLNVASHGVLCCNLGRHLGRPGPASLIINTSEVIEMKLRCTLAIFVESVLPPLTSFQPRQYCLFLGVHLQ